MGTLPLIAALGLLAAAPRSAQNDSGSGPKIGGKVAPPVHTARPPQPHGAQPVSPRPHPAKPAAPAPAPEPVPQTPTTGEVAHHHHHPDRQFYGVGPGYVPWVPLRVYQGVDELQMRGPGAITQVDNPDPVDSVLVGNWKVVLPVITAAEDGFGHVDTFRESKELGRLSIRQSGDYEWDVPGQFRSTGQLTEVTASDASPDDHYWSFDGSGQTFVIAPGQDGTLLIYDAGNNAFFGRAIRD